MVEANYYVFVGIRLTLFECQSLAVNPITTFEDHEKINCFVKDESIYCGMVIDQGCLFKPFCQKEISFENLLNLKAECEQLLTPVFGNRVSARLITVMQWI